MYQKIYKVMELYLGDFRGRYYLREISRLTKLPLRTTQRVLKDLEEGGVMKSEKSGKNRYYFLNLKNTRTKLHLLIAEINRTLEFLKRYKPFNMFLGERIEACLVVFGSFASFRADRTSDLDLLIIGKEELPFHLLPYRVHKISLTKKQFEQALKNRDTVIKEILKNHVILTDHSYFLEALWSYYGEA